MPCRQEHDEEAGGGGAEEEEEEAPYLVVPVERLYNDVTAMLAPTEGKEPPRGRLRPENTLVALYLPGDASGSGFGSVVINKEGIIYQSGTWAQDWREESSNFRESDNLVMRIETLVKNGTATNHEVFVFTDCSSRAPTKDTPRRPQAGEYYSEIIRGQPGRPSCSTRHSRSRHTNEGMGSEWSVEGRSVGRHNCWGESSVIHTSCAGSR